MNTPLLTAIIAAVVSMAIGVLAFWGTARNSRAQIEALERSLKRQLTENLLKERLACYPEGFRVTDALRSERWLRESDSEQTAVDVHGDLSEWLRGTPALVMSSRTIEASFALKNALVDYADSEAARLRVWELKNLVRACLRVDLGLLHAEDAERYQDPSDGRTAKQLPRLHRRKSTPTSARVVTDTNDLTRLRDDLIRSGVLRREDIQEM